MYNSRNFLVNNALDRYAISTHLGNLTYNTDGSLEIYIQNTSPGPAKQVNWLPAPSDAFHLVMRLYWPQEAVLNGSWCNRPFNGWDRQAKIVQPLLAMSPSIARVGIHVLRQQMLVASDLPRQH